MSDLLNLGLTGLRTSRNNLSVTGHNISNIDTPGYSRQRAVQITNSPFGTGSGYMGAGARTQTIERIVEQYTVHQVRVDTSRLKDNEAYLRNASELDNLLSNENSALGTALNVFFEGMQSAANDPLSMPARQLAMSQADGVSQRFKTAQARLSDQNTNLNSQLRIYASKINELGSGIAELNQQIIRFEGAQNQPPNDLYDRRDELLRELSEYVDVNVQEQDGRVGSVVIGNGIPLVVGQQANKVEAATAPNDKSRYQIFITDSTGARTNISSQISGGEMGGVLRYRTDTLDPALNEMGRIALVFAGEINKQHQAGTDLQGDQGGDFFRDINTREFQLDRIPGIQRDAPAGVWLDPDGLNKLSAQEFLLRQQGGNFVLQDSATGKDKTPAGGPFATMAALNTALQETYGFRLTDGSDPIADMDATIQNIANLIQQDGLLISPTRLGASQLERDPDLNNINKIALSGISASESNTGTALVAYEQIGSPAEFNLHSAGLTGYEIKVQDSTAAPPTFEVLDNAGNVTPLVATYAPNAAPAVGGVLTIANADGAGNSLSLTVNDNDFATDDAWVLEGAAGGGNGAALAALQLAKLVGRTEEGYRGHSLSETYSMLVEQTGVNTSESRTATEISKATLNLSIAMRESTSGVNMDEEAANLIRFQQAYMASSQVIATAQKLFDTLINSVR